MNGRCVKWIAVVVLALGCGLAGSWAFPIDESGARWAVVLDGMDVAHRWLAGEPIAWRTGVYSEKSRQEASHCSAFAAAACERAGVYLLRPPEHGQTLLANAQMQWLEGEEGARHGWRPVESAVEAQQLANRGWVVLAVYRNPDAHRAGHVAVVRPSEKSAQLIEQEGPQVIQAGTYNYQSTSVRQGFARHRGAFEAGEIHYFAHAPVETGR